MAPSTHASSTQYAYSFRTSANADAQSEIVWSVHVQARGGRQGIQWCPMGRLRLKKNEAQPSKCLVGHACRPGMGLMMKGATC
jgi:hypothetical protein